MKLELDANDINTALRNYLNDVITINEGSNVEFNLIAGRAGNGNRVEVEITLPGEEAKVEKPKQTRTRKATCKPAPEQVKEEKSEPVVEVKEPEEVKEVDPGELEFGAEGEEEIVEQSDDTDLQLAAATEKVQAEIDEDDADLFA